MIKILGLHRDCINDILTRIASKYQNRKFLLDIGCGNGYRTLFFDNYDRVIFGVDRTNWLIEQARKKINFKQLDFVKEALLYQDGFFDMTFSFDVIEHLSSPEIMLREIHRVLNNNGVFIISTPNRHRILSFILLVLRLRKIPYAPDKNTKKNDPYAWHVVEYTSGELEKLLNLTGFDVTKKHKIFYGITGGYGFSCLFGLPFYHNIIFECRKQKDFETK